MATGRLDFLIKPLQVRRMGSSYSPDAALGRVVFALRCPHQCWGCRKTSGQKSTHVQESYGILTNGSECDFYRYHEGGGAVHYELFSLSVNLEQECEKFAGEVKELLSGLVSVMHDQVDHRQKCGDGKRPKISKLSATCC